jgi:hypothetical protein
LSAQPTFIVANNFGHSGHTSATTNVEWVR